MEVPDATFELICAHLRDIDEAYMADRAILEALKILLVSEGAFSREKLAEVIEVYARSMMRAARVSGLSEESMASRARVAQMVREFADMKGEPLVKRVEDGS